MGEQDSLNTYNVDTKTYLDLASDDIGQCLPFKIIWKLFKASPLSGFGGGAILILAFYELTRFIVTGSKIIIID